MHASFLYKLVFILQFVTYSQHSHVQEAKHHIRSEVRTALGVDHLSSSSSQHHYHQHHHHHQSPMSLWWPEKGSDMHRVPMHRNRWSGGRRHSVERHQFTAWSVWTPCGADCVKRRERYCLARRKCGHTKHVEEQKCRGCHAEPVWQPIAPYEPPNVTAAPPFQSPRALAAHQVIIINAAAISRQQQQLLPVYIHHIQMPLLQEVPAEQHPYQQHGRHRHHSAMLAASTFDSMELDAKQEPAAKGAYANEDDDFYVLQTKRPNFKRKPQPILVDADDYDEVATEDDDSDRNLDNDSDFNDDRKQLLATDGDVSSAWNSSNEEEGYDSRRVHAARLHDTRLRQHERQRHRERHHRQQQQERRQQPLRRLRQPRRVQQVALWERSLAPSDDDVGDGIEGDTFQYEDFDFEPDVPGGRFGVADSQYSDVSYEDADYADYRNATATAPSKEKATPEALIPRHRRVYSKWSRWTKCSPKCTTRRYKKCRVKEQCGREVLREIAYCYTEGSFCQQWLQTQVQKSSPYELRPVAASRRRDISLGASGTGGVGGGGTQSNAIVSDFIMNGKGYRGPEYAPMKLRCGIAPIRSHKRNMYNMLKIIGGKAARKGEWPWQVAIFNRFKEAFCGGTLIAPQWVLTAAHCVRKVLHVRIGEHNLDYEDGTELQLRVLKSFKHPNFDKKTVDSDVALLKLPKPVNSTTWIGYSCLPRPYQPLPKSMDCTVIGWGKRRNRDIAGTSVLHQAEVPIIPMDNCRSVYHDYTITKNMFCAGHRRGRIDTCAGDSGGPLLCRDTTKPNHPWTIFGITSFGDGCAKRNKFGIYAKVPNYVDWVWSVVNCNGNCKLHQRSYMN